MNCTVTQPALNRRFRLNLITPRKYARFFGLKCHPSLRPTPNVRQGDRQNLGFSKKNPWALSSFRAEKRYEHAWTFFPRSPGRVWKNGGISNILLPKNKMFPLITWKEQAICLQKLQAVVITLSLLNFLEEYLIVKRTLTTSISLRCTGNVHA